MSEPANPEWRLVNSRPQLARALCNFRKARGLAQLDLADLTGLQRSTISNIERCEQSLNVESLWKIADALGVDIALRPRERVDAIARCFICAQRDLRPL